MSSEPAVSAEAGAPVVLTGPAAGTGRSAALAGPTLAAVTSAATATTAAAQARATGEEGRPWGMERRPDTAASQGGRERATTTFGNDG
ncbi:hypothetical protein GCM10020256_35950 [Streptomyces thermocoprophilus]